MLKFNININKYIYIIQSYTTLYFIRLYSIRLKFQLHVSAELCSGADKSLARPTSRCILFGGENISFDSSLVMYINSTTIPPIMIINRI